MRDESRPSLQFSAVPFRIGAVAGMGLVCFHFSSCLLIIQLSQCLGEMQRCLGMPIIIKKNRDWNQTCSLASSHWEQLSPEAQRPA